ncbi:topoisomerase DNA-binding C4 zinc finger domain-containing protein [Methylomonas lenta]|nr:topoisomerase DNA-binding C4 zinc finger domain-containing protein [Methylomonas lenta]
MQKQQNDNNCLKCGSPMLLRTASSGTNQGNQFWGCSGFPKCRAVRPVS